MTNTPSTEPRKSDPHGPTHLVDKLDKASLFNLALEQSAANDGRRAYQLPSREELTPLLPELEIQQLLGTGGMGCVYLARQPRLDRMVAVKILPKELARDEKFAERFSREARAMARLNHPNIVRVYDFGTAGDIGFLIMEYMDGMNLRELLESGSLSADEACRIFDQVSSALQYAHDEGVIHRDIKPENILFSRAGHVSLADFGLARLAVGSGCEVSLTQTRQAMGTLNYMAPEQWDDPKSVDHRADVYAMGILLYELLTGRVPRGSFPPASSLAAVPTAVDEVIHKALQVSPDKRFATVADMNAVLASAIAGGPQTDAIHNGTLTRVLNFGGLLKRATPKPAAASTPVTDVATSRQARRNSAFHISVFVAAATLILLVMPWCRTPNSSESAIQSGNIWSTSELNSGSGFQYVPGYLTSSMVNNVEVPNAIVFLATILTSALIAFRHEVGSLRAYFFGLILTSLALALTIGMLTGEAPLVIGAGLGPADNRILISPFGIAGLLTLQILEMVIQLVVVAFRPITDYLVLPVHRHFSRKEQERKKWWADRWLEVKGVFGKGDDKPPNAGERK